MSHSDVSVVPAQKCFIILKEGVCVCVNVYFLFYYFSALFFFIQFVIKLENYFPYE